MILGNAIILGGEGFTREDEGKVVQNGALAAQTARTVTANGVYDTTANNSVTVNVESGGGTLVPKTITQNGTYDPAEDQADGYSSVTVNVPSGGGGAVDALMTQGIISQDSDYCSAPFDAGVDPTAYDFLLFEVFRNNSTAPDGTAVLRAPVTLPNSFKVVGAQSTYTLELSAGAVAASYYTGSWTYLTVNVTGIKL